VNNWDAHWNYNLGGHYAYAGMYGVHHNGYEDRLFKVYHKRIGTTQIGGTGSGWTGWVNNMDAQFTYSCPNNMAIVGMQSYHHNGYEDRRWRIRCARFHGITIRKLGWPGWQTQWDRPFALHCPGNQVLVGWSGVHNNGYEDRLFRIQCGIPQRL